MANNSLFISQSVPSTLSINQVFSVTWSFPDGYDKEWLDSVLYEQKIISVYREKYEI